MFSVARPPKLFHIPSNGSLKGCLIALVGLLTLRLPSLGWVLTCLRHFYFISLVCLRYPLSFVLFCFFRCPAQGLAACRYFLFKLSCRFFQIDLLAQLNTRIKTLEDAGNDVPAHLSKITSYGFRREEDFDKYDALNMAEQLATAAKLSGHEKAPTYDAIACTLREKLPFNKKQFKAYFVALLADKEYAKVLEAVAKVDKSFKSSVPSTASGSTGVPAQASARPPPDVQGSIAMRVVRLVTRRPDASNGSITEVTHSRGLAPLCRLLEDNSLFIPCTLCVAMYS